MAIITHEDLVKKDKALLKAKMLLCLKMAKKCERKAKGDTNNYYHGKAKYLESRIPGISQTLDFVKCTNRTMEELSIDPRDLLAGL